MKLSDYALIRLYYESYGWSDKEIAEALNISRPLVSLYIKEKGLKKAANLPATTNGNGDTSPQPQDLLKVRDLDRQLTLAPFYARTEIAIVATIQETVQNLDPSDPSTPMAISTLARAWKDMKSASLTNKLDTSSADSAGVSVQILNSL